MQTAPCSPEEPSLDPVEVEFAIAQLRKMWMDHFTWGEIQDVDSIITRSTREAYQLCVPTFSRKGIAFALENKTIDDSTKQTLETVFKIYEHLRDEALSDVKGPFARAYRGLGLHAQPTTDGLWIEPVVRLAMHLKKALNHPTRLDASLPRSTKDNDEEGLISLVNLQSLPHLIPPDLVTPENLQQFVPTKLDDDVTAWLHQNERAWSAPSTYPKGYNLNWMSNVRLIMCTAEACPEWGIDVSCPTCGHSFNIIGNVKNHDLSSEAQIVSNCKMLKAECDQCGVIFGPLCPRVNMSFTGLAYRDSSNKD